MKLLGISLLFLCLYGPRLVALDVLLFFNLLASLFLSTLVAHSGRVSAHFIVVSSYLLFWSAVYYATLMIYYPYQDIELVLTFFRILIYASAAYLVVMLLKTARVTYEKLLLLILIFTAVNSIFVLLFFISSGFSSWASGVLNYQSQLAWLETGHRIFDISLGGGASGSFTFSLAFIIGLFLFWRGIFRRYLYVLLPLVFIATAMMGRTGFFLNCIAIALFTMKYIYVSKRIVLFLFIMSLLMIIFPVVYYGGKDLIGDSVYVNWLLEGIFRESENQTYKAILNMWYLPGSTEELLWGSGNLGRTDIYPYVDSDVGYIRSIHAYGLFGLVVLYLVPVLYFLKLSRYLGEYKLLLYLFLVWFLVMNLKEFHIVNRGSIFIFFSVLWGGIYLGRFKVNET